MSDADDNGAARVRAHGARPILTSIRKPIPADLPPDKTLDEEPYLFVLYRGGGQASRSLMKVYLWA